jgi:phosphate transport system substrate-binding protein
MPSTPPPPRLAPGARRVLALALLAALAPATPRAAEPTEPSAGPSVITVKGSDTIGGELGPAIAKAYMATHPGVSIQWEALGSATAFPGLFDGTAQLGASSRPVNSKELAQARESGVELKEFVLGYDGIAVIVHPTNPVKQLTLEQLAGLFSGKTASWREVGGRAVPVKAFGRPSYSGTHAFFRDKVVRLGKKEAKDDYTPGTTFLEKSEELVQAVAADPAAIAYVGMGYVKPGVRALGVAAGEGQPFFTATLETVRAGTYPIYRPLLLYTRGEPQGELRRLLAYLLGPEGRKAVASHDFTPSDVASPLAAAAPAGGATTAPAAPASRHFRVTFAYGEAGLSADAQATLAQAAQAAREGGKVRLVGHADALGSATSNQRVAAARVKAVADQLKRLGVPADRLQVEARGADEPLATNSTSAGRKENRRVDLEVLPRR